MIRCVLDASRLLSERVGSDYAMPRRNRVLPSGEIVAVPERGTMLGNRGILHEAGSHSPALAIKTVAHLRT